MRGPLKPCASYGLGPWLGGMGCAFGGLDEAGAGSGSSRGSWGIAHTNGGLDGVESTQGSNWSESRP
eukprot:4184068-Prymnesium_polylepis.1